MMRITRKEIRALIRETIGRGQETSSNPDSVDAYPGSVGVAVGVDQCNALKTELENLTSQLAVQTQKGDVTDPNVARERSAIQTQIQGIKNQISKGGCSHPNINF